MIFEQMAICLFENIALILRDRAEFVQFFHHMADSVFTFLALKVLPVDELQGRLELFEVLSKE